MNSEEINENPTAENLAVEVPVNNEETNTEETQASETTEVTETAVEVQSNETSAEPTAETAVEPAAVPEELPAEEEKTMESSTPPNLTEEQTQNQPDDTVAAEENPVEETPAEEAPVAAVETETTMAAPIEAAPVESASTESAAVTSPDEAQAKSSRPQNNWKEHFDDVFNVLKAKKENNETIEVEVKSRIRGGLRVVFDEMPLFLPASHFSLKRTPTEQELHDVIGTKFNVNIHELQEFDDGRKAVIVSRKQLMLDEFWTSISVGDVVEGRVSSVASFGVFVDLGGVEGLIHISRLSQVHVNDPSTMFKKGDKVVAAVVELDRSKNRIALSRKELEESPWKNVEAEYEPGTQHKGIVRRLTEFGAYVELKPGVDGLLRTAEISWTKRIRKPSDVFQPGQEIMVEVLAVSTEKQTVALSYKKTQPNPWEHMAAQFPVNAEYEGTIAQVLPQGAIISITEEVDGFMPRSKMKNVLRGNKIPYHPGETIQVKIADLIPEEESLILAPAGEEEMQQQQQQQQSGENSSRPPRRNQDNRNAPSSDKMKAPAGGAQGTGVTLLDMLSDADKSNLFNLSE